MGEETEEIQPAGLPPAGWLPDPSGSHELRYWTGAEWTEHVHDRGTATADMGEPEPILEDQTPPKPAGHRRLKMVLAVIGGIFLVLVIGIGSCVASLAVKVPGLNEESQAYADETIEAVCTDWDQSALEERLSPEFWEVTDDADLDKLFEIVGKLGPLESFETSRGEANIQRFLGQEERVTAVYHAEAEFDEGPATITLTLIKHDDEWQVAGFNVNSMVFFEDD